MWINTPKKVYDSHQTQDLISNKLDNSYGNYFNDTEKIKLLDNKIKCVECSNNGLRERLNLYEAILTKKLFNVYNSSNELLYNLVKIGYEGNTELLLNDLQKLKESNNN